MDFENLEQELREQLPAKAIRVDIEQGIASYYDFHGVTFREESGEQHYANGYVARVISEKAGFPIKVVGETDGNGHCAVYFKKLKED